MTTPVCIHGHFYQPPRFDPWLEHVPPEGSAAPDHDWNARVTRECYAPVAVARILDGRGRIRELFNCYAWMSFNFGPTLLRWMEQHAPDTYARILDADRQSLLRLGYGNALAQVYHHAIMPLATDMDKDLEVAWAIQDFQARFRRAPDGMWLAETAVDLPTLEALVKHNVRFTILAPRQARAVRSLKGGEFREVDEDSLDTTRPYLVRLPSGSTITVFFYHGPTSRAVAFERLLENGENFWNRLLAVPGSGLRHIATDGESYGHHFMFGEMALAYVLDQGRQRRDSVELTNYAAYLAACPTGDEVLLHENSSWSCVHGLERWKTHCGCSDGGHPDWMQDWRRPLRRSLNYLKYYVDEYFHLKLGPRLFYNPQEALTAYGRPLAGSQALEAFLAEHCRPGLHEGARYTACRMLLMQRMALASFSSCAWFFDDIARLEPLNALSAARRAMDLLQELGGPDIETGFVRVLSEAQSNLRDDWDGEVLWREVITPRRPSLASLSAYVAADERQEWHWPGLTLTREGAIVRGVWTWTGDAEICPFPAVLPPLPAAHRTELALAESRRLEDVQFEALVQAAQEVLPLLEDFTEGQRRPQAHVTLLVPGLAWHWLTSGADAPLSVLDWLATWLGRNPEVRDALARRAERQGMTMSTGLPDTAAALGQLIRRARRLDLGMAWWNLQNKVMDLPAASPLLQDLRCLLGLGECEECELP